MCSKKEDEWQANFVANGKEIGDSLEDIDDVLFLLSGRIEWQKTFFKD